MRNRRLRRAAAIGLLGLGLAGSLASCRPEKTAEPTPAPADDAFTDLDVGLSDEEREVWRWTSEGSDLVPVGALGALYDKDTGRPFTESLARFGFLPSPESPANPDGLPVGWVTDVPELSILELSYVGVNCAACHTGEIEYRGQRLRIDGAPNLADIEALALAARDSAVAMLENPIETFRFVRRLARHRGPDDGAESLAAGPAMPADTLAFLDRQLPEVQQGLESAAAPTLARELGESYARLLRGETEPGAELERVAAGSEEEGLELAQEARGHVARSQGFVATYAALLRDRLGLVLRAIRALEISPAAGPGRDDPWGILRNVLFRRETPLTAPTSIPHLFHSREFGWYHADGNTNTVTERDIAQAVALGAYVDEATFQSTLRPRSIWELERVLAEIGSPAWPADVFGPIDRERAERGAEIFRRKEPAPAGGAWSCSGCHASRKGVLFKLAAVGTDPNRAQSFLEPLDGAPFHEKIPEAVSKIAAVAFDKAGVTPEEVRRNEPASDPRWRGTGKYQARQLDGVWATAPYLHNGSVPTLYDLLLPPAERPRSFPLGHREYDPKKVGYVTDSAAPVFVFDTSVDGNSNAGHDFGTGLSDAERWDLVEYLKTR